MLNETFNFSTAIDIAHGSASIGKFSELIDRKLGTFAESFSLQSGWRVKDKEAVHEERKKRKLGLQVERQVVGPLPSTEF